MKKTYLLFCSFVFMLLFMCSCQMSIDGNFISVENFVSDDTLDKYNFPIPRIKTLYFHSDDYKREYVDIVYNNGYAKTYSITQKEIEYDNIYYELDNEKRLSVINLDKYNVVCIVFSSMKRTEYMHTDFSKYHDYQSYTSSSISYSKESPIFNTPSFNEIHRYKTNGEVIGNVKSVSNTKYIRKEIFGEDSLIFMKRYNIQYDSNGNLLNVKYENEYFKETLYSREYDRNGNIISEHRGTTNVKYENNINELNQIVSFYDKNKIVAYMNMRYTPDKEFTECDYYDSYNNYSGNHEIYLDRKIKYKKDYNGCIYGTVYAGNGKELYKNKYDSDYSILDGRIDLGYYSEYFNPFERYGTYDTMRDCIVTYNGYNTDIKIKNPYGGKIKDNILSEHLTYNENCNIVKREIEYIEYWAPRDKQHIRDKYIIIYKYDLKGNWIERHSILTSHVVDGKEAEVDARGYIEYRNIEYFD